MHALVIRVTIHDADRARDVLNNQVVPQLSGAPGFKTGYWTWPTDDGGQLNGLSMVVYDSEDNARGAGDRLRAIAADAQGVTLDGVEIREVVASA